METKPPALVLRYRILRGDFCSRCVWLVMIIEMLYYAGGIPVLSVLAAYKKSTRQTQLSNLASVCRPIYTIIIILCLECYTDVTIIMICAAKYK